MRALLVLQKNSMEVMSDIIVGNMITDGVEGKVVTINHRVVYIVEMYLDQIQHLLQQEFVMQQEDNMFHTPLRHSRRIVAGDTA